MPNELGAGTSLRADEKLTCTSGDFMRLTRKALIVAALALSILSSSAQAAAVVDQSFTTPNNLSAAINECCRFVAQTFTAGRTGDLEGVNIDVLGFRSGQLHIAIRTVADGRPTATVLGETVLASNSAPLSLLITFPERIAVVAGTQYAIVVDYEGAPPPGPDQARGSWAGAVDDVYPRGSLFFSFSDGVTWFGETGFDVHFRTYVTGTADLLADLGDAVEGVGPGTSLRDKMTDAQSALASNEAGETCQILRSFINEVKAQSGKSITSDSAASLINDPNRIRIILAC